MYAKFFVLFAILLTGWFLKKIKFIDDKLNQGVNKFIVYFAYPCVIVYNIGRLEMTRQLFGDFILTLVISLVCLFGGGLLCRFYAKTRRLPVEEAPAMELSMVVPNDAFMGFPVALIFFGQTGMLLMVAHNAAMNFYVFTYGMSTLRRGRIQHGRTTFRSIIRALLKLAVNPNIIALVLGLAVSVTGLGLPDPVLDYLDSLGGVSTPLAMICIGSTLAGCSFKEIIGNIHVLESAAMKLFWIPLLTLAAVYFLPVSPLIKCVVIMGGAFPTAATCCMLAEQEKRSPELTSQILFISTVLSIATVPLTINVLNMIFQI